MGGWGHRTKIQLQAGGTTEWGPTVHAKCTKKSLASNCKPDSQFCLEARQNRVWQRHRTTLDTAHTFLGGEQLGSGKIIYSEGGDTAHTLLEWGHCTTLSEKA